MTVDLRVRKTQRHTVLVVDDDRRVRELLEVALSAHGFHVITSADGEDAVRRARVDQPDLLVLDVRLPRKSGLEVCDVLRGDPQHSALPVILVSAIGETDARLQAFSRGADDFLSKPFSPKELIARIKRLLERSSEARLAKRRAVELEHELKLARDATRRAHMDSLHERDLRELSVRAARDLHGRLDLDDLARTALDVVRARLGVRVAALLCRDEDDAVLRARSIRGDSFERTAGLELSCDGELGVFLAGLGRPAVRRELERFPELKEETAAFMACGFALLAPVRSPRGLEALIVTDERSDGCAFARADSELLSAYTEALAVAMPNANRLRRQMDQWLLALASRAHRSAAERAAHQEAAGLVDRAARALALPPRQREMLAHGVTLGTWARSISGRRMMERVRNGDPTGRLLELEGMIERSIEMQSTEYRAPELWRADHLLAIGLGYVAERLAAAGPQAALSAALERVAVDGSPSDLHGAWVRELCEALTSAVREAQASESAT